jgi:hypothetical protein
MPGGVAGAQPIMAAPYADGKPTISWVWQVNLLDRPCTFAGQLAHNGSHYETFYIDCASSIS